MYTSCTLFPISYTVYFSPLPRFITLLTKTHPKPNTGSTFIREFFYLSLYMKKPHVVFFIFIIFCVLRENKEWILRIGCLVIKKNIDCILMVKVWLRWTFVESFETNNNGKSKQKKKNINHPPLLNQCLIKQKCTNRKISFAKKKKRNKRRK